MESKHLVLSALAFAADIAPMHASTPPRQQGIGGYTVPESPLGTPLIYIYTLAYALCKCLSTPALVVVL